MDNVVCYVFMPNGLYGCIYAMVSQTSLLAYSPFLLLLCFGLLKPCYKHDICYDSLAEQSGLTETHSNKRCASTVSPSAVCLLAYLFKLALLYQRFIPNLVHLLSHVSPPLFPGSQFRALVEYAPSQCVPRLTCKKDGREGTIVKGKYFYHFISTFNQFLLNLIQLYTADIQYSKIVDLFNE